MCTCIFFLDLSFPIHAMGTKKTPSRGCRNKRGAVCVMLGREPGTQQGFRALPGSGRACSGSEPARAHPLPQALLREPSRSSPNLFPTSACPSVPRFPPRAGTALKLGLTGSVTSALWLVASSAPLASWVKEHMSVPVGACPAQRHPKALGQGLFHCGKICVT